MAGLPKCKAEGGVKIFVLGGGGDNFHLLFWSLDENCQAQLQLQLQSQLLVEFSINTPKSQPPTRVSTERNLDYI